MTTRQEAVWQRAAVFSTVKRVAWRLGRQRDSRVVRPSGVPDHTGEQQGVGGSARNPWLTASSTLLVPVGAQEFDDNVRGACRLLPGSLARDLVCELWLRLWCDS